MTTLDYRDLRAVEKFVIEKCDARACAVTAHGTHRVVCYDGPMNVASVRLALRLATGVQFTVLHRNEGNPMQAIEDLAKTTYDKDDALRMLRDVHPAFKRVDDWVFAMHGNDLPHRVAFFEHLTTGEFWCVYYDGTRNGRPGEWPTVVKSTPHRVSAEKLPNGTLRYDREKVAQDGEFVDRVSKVMP